MSQSNILKAILHMVQHDASTQHTGTSQNRANAQGDALEDYIKDAFAECLASTDTAHNLRQYHSAFSWTGTQNAPPDIIVKNGHAIEVKKSQSAKSSLALNSSYPKNFLYRDDPKLTNDCKACDGGEWVTKPLIYASGHIPKGSNQIKSIWFVYGNLYAAPCNVYSRIVDTMTQSVSDSGYIMEETKEIGRVNQVDPLGITNLRIRGMWEIKNPRTVYNYLPNIPQNTFEIVALIPADVYNDFPQKDKESISLSDAITINNVSIKNPANAAQFISAKQIIYTRL